VVEPLVDRADPTTPPTPAPPSRPAGLPAVHARLGGPRHLSAFEPGDELPIWAGFQPPRQPYLFDTDIDPGEHENRAGTALERELLDAMATALRQIEALADLRVRMGIG
jgi:hypothetical protein